MRLERVKQPSPKSLDSTNPGAAGESCCSPSCLPAGAKAQVDKPEGSRKNILWTDRSRIELFVFNEKPDVKRKNTASEIFLFHLFDWVFFFYF